MSGRLAVGVLAALAGTVPSFACPDGRYQLQDRRRASIRPRQVIAIEAGQVAIEEFCAPVPARIRTTPRGTTVRAKWSSCDRLGGPVRLRARIGRRCLRMRGTIRRRTAVFSRFSAYRVPVCGDGVVDRGEGCDDGNTADGDCCSAACRIEGSDDCNVTCASNADCRETDYCAKRVGDCDGPGRCATRPGACLQRYDPVCGCDGSTYGNACDAASAGVSVRATGTCPRRCGGIAGIDCPDGQFCDYDTGACRVSDVAGVCVPVVNLCTLEIDPVCGCDGMTYSNDCQRRAKQVQKDHDGPCAGR